MSFWEKNSNTEPEVLEEEKENEKVVELPKQKYFAVWHVGKNEFKLKLQTAGVKELEKKYKMAIMDLMQGENGMPPLSVQLEVLHVAMKPWNSGLTAKNVEVLYDKYLEEGGDLLSFYANVYLEIFMVSGFLSKKMKSEMMASLEEMKKEL